MEDQYIQIRLRMQDRSNYIYLQCNSTTYVSRFCEWHRVIDGHDETIAKTDFWAIIQFVKIEVQDDVYRVYYNTTNDGFQQMKIVDTNFRSGGIGLFIEAGNRGTSLDGIEVKKLP
jgi:hypothetical protein